MLTRRQFLFFSSIGAAGVLLPGTASAMMNGGGMGGGVIDPPPGLLFKDPVENPNISEDPDMVEVHIEAKKPAPYSINGVNANLSLYGNYPVSPDYFFPGPTVRVKKGQLLKVHFKNNLPMSMETNILGHHRYMTNLHYHGLHVSPAGIADNVMLSAMPGESLYYELDLSDHEPGNLNIYHPHIHGTVAEQMWEGLSGALLVEDPDTVLAGYETHIMVIKDLKLSGTEPEPYTSIMDYMHGKEGDIVTVNGQVNPVLNIRPGQVQRWRILNISNARFYKLSLGNHAMYLIGTDGGLLDKPYPQTEILISPGERVDVLVKANQKARDYKFRSLPYSRTGMMSSPTITLLTLRYNGPKSSQSVPSSVNPNAKRLDMDTSALPKQTFVLSMRQGNGYINGQTFEEDPYTIMSRLGTYEIWEIINQSNMDHPWHQHTNSSQILSITGGDSKYASLYTTTPSWKDVVIVPKMGGRVTMLVPVMHYTGMSMFHCHIVEHEDIGMMGIWDIMPMDEPPM